MTSQEFVIWLKGFTEGVHEYNVTPKQWDLLKEKLGQVIGDDNKFVETPGFPFGTPNTTPYTPDTTPINPVINPFPTWQHPHYPNPLDNPFRVTCGEEAGTRSISSVWRLDSLTGSLTASGSSTITISSGSAWTGTTTYFYPNGTSVTYITNAPSGSLTTINKTLLND
jgi:hypothetical protein